MFRVIWLILKIITSSSILKEKKPSTLHVLKHTWLKWVYYLENKQTVCDLWNPWMVWYINKISL